MAKFLTVNQFATENKEIGTWPHNIRVIRGLKERGKTNGFSKAFITVGRRVLIDVDLFWEILESKRGI